MASRRPSEAHGEAGHLARRPRSQVGRGGEAPRPVGPHPHSEGLGSTVGERARGPVPHGELDEPVGRHHANVGVQDPRAGGGRERGSDQLLHGVPRVGRGSGA